jgi:hypothetical protein
MGLLTKLGRNYIQHDETWHVAMLSVAIKYIMLIVITLNVVAPF